MGRKHSNSSQTFRRRYVRPRRYWLVGEYLAAARKKAGLTQRSVSLSLGYSSAQFISNFERGIAVPSFKKLRQLQRLYQMEIHELVEVLIRERRERLRKELLAEKKKNPTLSRSSFPN